MKHHNHFYVKGHVLLLVHVVDLCLWTLCVTEEMGENGLNCLWLGISKSANLTVSQSERSF